nr:MAG TPA: hypothetical protein [Caudoviricetes sp.]
MVYTISGFKVKTYFFTVVLYTYTARICGYTLTLQPIGFKYSILLIIKKIKKKIEKEKHSSEKATSDDCVALCQTIFTKN